MVYEVLETEVNRPFVGRLGLFLFPCGWEMGVLMSAVAILCQSSDSLNLLVLQPPVVFDVP